MKKLIEFISLKIISPFNWTRIKFLFTGRAYDLTSKDREEIREEMQAGLRIWVSRRETHLTTYFIGFFDWALAVWAWFKNGRKGIKPKWGFWTHAFANINSHEIMEAIAKGVTKSMFDDAFNCEAAAALVPANLSVIEWHNISKEIVEELKLQDGKKYDSGFNLKDESKVSCIELMRLVLMKRVKDYHYKFADLEEDVRLYKNLTPQMLYDSKSFKVVWEVRR